MCTVTFIPYKHSYYITSNRDEKNRRSTAWPPDVYSLSTGKILYPKDGDAEGTWIAVHENGNIVVLLNGAFVEHTPSPPYKKSRGLIVLDIVDNHFPYERFLSTDLENIEPFTVIIIDNKKLYECRWDGKLKHYQQLNERAPYIWSSATLYNDSIMQKRKNWFEQWLSENPHPSQTDVLYFHQFTGDEDIHNNLRMNRDGKVSTVSITSIERKASSLSMQYLDLKNQLQYNREITAANKYV